MGLVEWGNHNFWTSGPTSCNIHKASGACSDLRWGFAVASRWNRLKLERCLNQFGTCTRWKCSGVSEATDGWGKAVANLMSCLVCKDFPNMQFLSKEKTTVKFPSRNRLKKVLSCAVAVVTMHREALANSALAEMCRSAHRTCCAKSLLSEGSPNTAAWCGSQPRHHLSKKVLRTEDWGYQWWETGWVQVTIDNQKNCVAPCLLKYDPSDIAKTSPILLPRYC